MCRFSWNLGATFSWNPQALSRRVQGLFYHQLNTRFRVPNTLLCPSNRHDQKCTSKILKSFDLCCHCFFFQVSNTLLVFVVSLFINEKQSVLYIWNTLLMKLATYLTYAMARLWHETGWCIRSNSACGDYFFRDPALVSRRSTDCQFLRHNSCVSVCKAPSHRSKRLSESPIPKRLVFLSHL